MTNKGYFFEAEVTDFFRDLFKEALKNTKNKIFRVIGSGRNKLATKTGGESTLMGDVSIELETLPKNILIECKHYKSRLKERSFSIKKEWLDQALDEAMKIGRWSFVAIKFKGVAPNSLELKKYVWANGKFGNNVHYIIPENHLAEILLCIESSHHQVLNNNNVILSEISNDDLITEVRKRLEEKRICSTCLNGGNTIKLESSQSDTSSTENS